VVINFLNEAALALAGLLLLGLCGGWVVISLRLPFSALTAPLAGIGVFAIGIAGLWGRGGSSFRTAAALVIALTTAATLIVAWRTPRARVTLAALLAVVAVLLLSVLTNSTATLRVEGPAIGMGDSSEQANYGQVADWITDNRAKSILAPAERGWLYEKFPRDEVSTDPRSGAFYYLALIKMLRGASGLFSYDLACTIAWAAVILGVASVFARTPLTLWLLIIGLVTVSWYDYGRSAFFGKLLAYPSALFVLGLALSGRPTSSRVTAALLLTIGASTLHSGHVTALMVATVGGAFLLSAAAFQRRVPAHAPLIGLMFVAALATTGALTRIIPVGYPSIGMGWLYIVPRALDLQNHGPLQDLGITAALCLTALAGAVWLALIGMAWRQRRADALGLLVGPLALLMALLLMGARTEAYQLLGFFYSSQLCAAALLLNDVKPQFSRAFVGIVLVTTACIALRVPRTWLGIDRYAISAPPSIRYSRAEIEALIRVIAGRPVLVDTGQNVLAYVLRAELLREGISVQWSERAWEVSLLRHFMNTPAPALLPAKFLILSNGETSPAGWRLIGATPAFAVFGLSVP
jgi:hypothetical protein